jgi:branched-subunit amino acid transport protein
VVVGGSGCGLRGLLLECADCRLRYASDRKNQRSIGKKDRQHAAAIAVNENTNWRAQMEKLVWEGLSLIYAVIGIVAGFLGLGHVPPMGVVARLSAVASCALTATILPDVFADGLTHFTGWSVPIKVRYVLAFFFGLGGMFIVPGTIVFWQSAAKNPMALVDWLRGKGPPPTPDPPKGGAE